MLPLSFSFSIFCRGCFWLVVSMSPQSSNDSCVREGDFSICNHLGIRPGWSDTLLKVRRGFAPVVLCAGKTLSARFASHHSTHVHVDGDVWRSRALAQLIIDLRHRCCKGITNISLEFPLFEMMPLNAEWRDCKYDKHKPHFEYKTVAQEHWKILSNSCADNSVDICALLSLRYNV